MILDQIVFQGSLYTIVLLIRSERCCADTHLDFSRDSYKEPLWQSFIFFKSALWIKKIDGAWYWDYC